MLVATQEAVALMGEQAADTQKTQPATAAPYTQVQVRETCAAKDKAAAGEDSLYEGRTVRSGCGYDLGADAADSAQHDVRAAQVKEALEGAVLEGIQKRYGYRFAKRTFDVVFSALMIVLFCWLFALIAVLIKIDDPKGPVFFKQKRVGRLDANGNPTYFTMYAKWVRPNVNVTFDSAGGTPVGAQSVVWDGKAQRPADPVRAGYAFGGWYYFGVDSAAPARFSFDMPLEGDVALVAAWKSLQEPVAYTVRHVSADGSVLAEQVLRGTVGQTVSAFALASDDALRQGFAYVDKAGEAIDLASDASQNVIVFTYANEPRHAFQVHLRDAATGLPVAADIDFDSVDAILNFRAPSIAGYRAAHGGQGYLTVRNGGQELTFWYVKDAEPSDDGELSSHEGDGAARTLAAFVGEEPGESAALAAATPADAGEARHAAKAVPSTGDDADIRVPAGIAVVSAVVVALGFGVRRRAKHAR